MNKSIIDGRAPSVSMSCCSSSFSCASASHHEQATCVTLYLALELLQLVLLVVERLDLLLLLRNKLQILLRLRLTDTFSVHLRGVSVKTGGDHLGTGMAADDATRLLSEDCDVRWGVLRALMSLYM